MAGLSVFKLFAKDREVWEKNYKAIQNIAWEKETKNLFNLISKYYKEFPENRYISKDELLEFLKIEYPTLKDKTLYIDLIDTIYNIDTSREVATTLITQLIMKDFANRIANAVIPILSGQETPDNLQCVEELLTEYRDFNPPEEEVDECATDDLDELLDAIGQDGIMWRLQCLSNSLGPLVGGTLGHLFARPETGKTTFLHSEVEFWLSQLGEDECVLWLNNEESKKRIKMRWFTSVTGLTKNQIAADREKAKQIYAKKGGHRMRLVDRANFTVEEIEQLCMKYKPRIVVIDQGDKVCYKGDGKAGNGADRLKNVYDKLREVTKRCNEHFRMDMLTIGQADVVAEGKKWLFLSNLDSGKTGKAGAFDYVIGIGKTYTEAGRRYIALCKNKLESGDDIGEKYAVNFDNVKARYYD